MISNFDRYDGFCLFGGLVFFAPVALLVRTQAGISESEFFLLQALLAGMIFLAELPTGWLTDLIGFRNGLVFSQGLLLLARCLLLGAFLMHSKLLFVLEAIVEGASFSFHSGTNSAYLYTVYGKDAYLVKLAHASNWETTGFLIGIAGCFFLYPAYGILGLLAATVITGTIGFGFSLCLPKEEAKPQNTRTKQPLSDAFVGLFHKRRSIFFVCITAVFSIAWILIHFFYAKLIQNCGLSVEWVSIIILLYSAFQMLGKPIIAHLKSSPSKKITVLLGAFAGFALVLLGLVQQAALLICLMILVPLLLSLPEYYLEEAKNRYVDEIGAGESRAAALSVFSMGSNLFEILALSASAVLMKAGAGFCFALVGVGLVLCMAVYSHCQEYQSSQK